MIKEPIPIVFAAADKLVGCDIFLPPSIVCDLPNIVLGYVLSVVTRFSSLNADTEDKAFKDNLVKIAPNSNDVPSDNAMAIGLLPAEQANDSSLEPCFKDAKANRRDFVFRNSLLYHNHQGLRLKIQTLCLPVCRRKHAMKLTHQNHLAYRNTKERIRLSF